VRFAWLIILAVQFARADIAKDVCQRVLNPSIERSLSQFNNPRFTVNAKHDRLEIDSTAYAALNVAGYLMPDGTLELALSTKPRPGRPRVPELRGRESFDLMVNYFNRDIRRIRGRWYYGDNLDMVNRLTRLGFANLETASMMTWTGRQAFRHGFTHVEIENAYGEAGHYESVIALFSRP
jgi:hypothetical protein